MPISDNVIDNAVNPTRIDVTSLKAATSRHAIVSLLRYAIDSNTESNVTFVNVAVKVSPIFSPLFNNKNHVTSREANNNFAIADQNALNLLMHARGVHEDFIDADITLAENRILQRTV
jgi:hypothetical protein